jgi:ATP-dependent DNA helicase PIF1
LATTNKIADNINNIATKHLPGTAKNCLSIDKILDDSKQAYYPTEFINPINISGLPPHNLKLKEGMPIIMLRNLNPNAGLCNGTRLIIKSIQRRFIEGTISVGKYKF